MANLFSHKLLQENIKNLTIPEMEEKIAVLQSWVNAITTKSIYKKTESECEQAFNLDIFHKVLGYTFYPTEHYTLEAKGGNEVSGQKADATLGYFNSSDIEKNVSLVQVAVEIKDANTSLTKSQRREGNLSPIQQGFKYKPQYNNCKWVIVTNFVEIRLFKDTQLDYELWNLVDLVNPENEYQNFKLFWYLLNAKHLIAYTNESKTEQLLSEVKEKTEQITKKFYQQYKLLRLELINDIRKNNSKISLDTVVQKSQKIIDRMVFAFFCEDNDLLPQGKIRNYIEKARSLDFTPWELLKKVFKGIDSGSEMLDIPKPGYNGGLFHPDALLDSLQISDVICQKFINLGEYDFKEELSVNILGHIFEQSISDLEEIRIDLLGTKLKTNELGESTKSNKRKKDGIFYTPEYIVDYIVKNSLGKYLEEQFESIEKKHLKNEKQMSDKLYQAKQKLIYGEYKQVLENITVLDPACGSGAFLVNVFDYLMAEHKRVGEALGMGSLFDNESTYKSILQRNIYGVDLNAESVEITKLSLWLKTAEKGKKLADLDNNIKCGNSLIDDPAVAGEKAFDWHKEFTEIMSKGGFDVIVGNPPYGAKISKNETDLLRSSYDTGKGNFDTYVFFVLLGDKLLKNKGYISYITPNTWLNLNSYGKFREQVLSKFSIIQITNLLRVFEDAMVDCCIFILLKDFDNKNDIEIIRYEQIVNANEKVKIFSNNLFTSKYSISQSDQLKNNEYVINYLSNPNTGQLLSKFNVDCVLLGDITSSSRGASFYGIGAGNPKQDREMIENRIYSSQNKVNENYYPVITGGDIARYLTFNPQEYILYGNNLFRSRERKYFFGEKLLFQRFRKGMYRQIIATYEDRDIVNSDGLSNFIMKNDQFDIKYVLAIANSILINFRYRQFFLDTNIRPTDLQKIPIKNISPSEQLLFIEKADQILSLNKQLYDKTNFTLRFFQSKFTIEKLSTKLSKFRELDFSGFLKELKVKKLPLDSEAELMRYFEKEKAEILALKAQIDAVDKEIDDMVFDLYGLTEEERRGIL